MDQDKYLGIYIHIPFCASRCAYCDFYTLAGHDALIDRYHKALLRHIAEASPQLQGFYIDSVYFGGGTPSYYGAGRLVELFNALKKHGRVLRDAEVTAEVNPDSITQPELARMHAAGFNRLSIGTQCADDGILKSLGRRHTFAQAAATLESARRAGFSNVSMDLIYGLPSQTREGWADTLQQVLALHPDHLSCYGLKIEEGSQLWIYKDSPFIPDDDAQADMYLYTVETLSRNGLKQYEISNFARPGLYSRHNMKYWTGQEYMIFGAAAHSYVAGRRYSFVPDAEKYADGVLNGGTLIDHCETISKLEQAGEYIMLGLRTNHGICRAEYQAIFQTPFDAAEAMLHEFYRRGWAVETNGRWSFTPQGFLLSNTLIGMLLEALSNQRRNTGTLRYAHAVDENQSTLFVQPAESDALFNGIS